MLSPLSEAVHARFEAVAVRALQKLGAQNALLRARFDSDAGALEAKIAAREEQQTLQSAEFQTGLRALEAKPIKP